MENLSLSPDVSENASDFGYEEDPFDKSIRLYKAMIALNNRAIKDIGKRKRRLDEICRQLDEFDRSIKAFGSNGSELPLLSDNTINNKEKQFMAEIEIINSNQEMAVRNERDIISRVETDLLKLKTYKENNGYTFFGLLPKRLSKTTKLKRKKIIEGLEKLVKDANSCQIKEKRKLATKKIKEFCEAIYPFSGDRDKNYDVGLNNPFSAILKRIFDGIKAGEFDIFDFEDEKVVKDYMTKKEKTIEELKKQKKDLEKKAEESKDEANNLEKRYKEENKKLFDDLTTAKREKESLITTNTFLIKQVEEVQSQNKELKSEVRGLKSEVRGLKGENRAIKEESRAIKEENRKLKDRVAKLEKDKEKLEKKVIDLEKENKQLKAKVAEFEKNQKSILNYIKRFKLEMEGLKTSNEELKKSNAELKAQIKQNNTSAMVNKKKEAKSELDIDINGQLSNTSSKELASVDDNNKKAEKQEKQVQKEYSHLQKPSVTNA